jgi:hypothetical protein
MEAILWTDVTFWFLKHSSSFGGENTKTKILDINMDCQEKHGAPIMQSTKFFRKNAFAVIITK